MGHAQSTNQPPKTQIIRRQHSAIFSLLSLGCASSPSLLSHDTSLEASEYDEKARSLDTEHHRAHRIRLGPTSSPQPQLAYNPSGDAVNKVTSSEYAAFLTEFPEYRLTWSLDALRRSDYGRLERAGETYVDYMGGSLYPESLVRVHSDFLNNNILGNTHSVSNSSKLSLHCATEARAAVLAFFKAGPEYTVIFTANATAALKLVGESYPFTGGSTYVLGADSHNSVHGIREFATYRGAQVCYVQSTPQGGLDPSQAKNILLRHRPRSMDLAPSLFAMTGQSNITNSKVPLSLLEYATSLGYHTLLDAAALASGSLMSLTETPVDAMALSFYKMFGYPTGVGALVIKKSFLEQLKRPWFAGGTVDVVQVPGTIVTRSRELTDQFEDGTINYLLLPSVTDGLRFLSAYLPFLPLRLSCLLHYLVSALSRLRHDTSDTPVARILSRTPSRRIKAVNEQADTGFMVSLIFLSPTGDMIPNTFIEYSASKQNISLRTGCMCNPGGAAALLGIQNDMRQLYPGVTLRDFEQFVGRELGVVRISLGLGSNFQDVWNVIQFGKLLASEGSRQRLWDDWMEASGIGQAL